MTKRGDGDGSYGHTYPNCDGGTGDGSYGYRLLMCRDYSNYSGSYWVTCGDGIDAYDYGRLGACDYAITGTYGYRTRKDNGMPLPELPS